MKKKNSYYYIIQTQFTTEFYLKFFQLTIKRNKRKNNVWQDPWCSFMTHIKRGY